MPHYVPHGNYPEGEKFNIVEQYKELLGGRDLEQVVYKIGNTRFFAFLSSGEFLYASQFQSNYGAKLVMLLSAIESLFGNMPSLMDIIASKSLKTRVVASSSGKEAYEALFEEIGRFENRTSTIKSIYSFYRDCLTQDEKIRLIKGIHLEGIYKKVADDEAFTMYTTETAKFPALESLEEIDQRLVKVVKHLIYDIRNDFVHRANYFPFPDKETLETKKLVHRTRHKGDIPKEEWIILLSFEALHEITRNAFINYWKGILDA